MSVSCEMDRGTNSKLRGKIALRVAARLPPAGWLPEIITSLRTQL